MRTLLATLALLLPLAAHAASVSLHYVDATGGAAFPGSTITLEVRVTANAGEMDNAVFGALNFSDALVNSQAALNEQFALPGGWQLGSLICTTAFCIAFSQVRQAGAIAVDVTDFVIARVRFVLDTGAPVGTVYNWSWRTTPTTQRFDFFGLTNAPGISVTSDQPPVPEPATAALFALGLAGIALARRRR